MKFDEPDEDGLSDELVWRMAHYDDGLARADDSSVAETPPLAPPLQERWVRLEGCLRLLRRAHGELPALGDENSPLSLSGETPVSFGRFRILAELGRGGFGVVYLADDPVLRRRVALKLPRADALANRKLRDRFLREARAAGSLDHPNVVAVYEAGEVGPVCYIASAYCPGTDLAAWLKGRTAPVPPRSAAALLASVAEAVEHAHAHGILHRDLKPSNILLAKLHSSAEHGERDDLNFVPKLTDFGLAKLLEVEADQTASGVILGTAAYMAPEQAEGCLGGFGPPTDVYALGVILYELLTLRVPFQGPSLLATIDQIRRADPLSPRKLVPGLPRELETVCLKCLQKDPRQRYATAGSLAADLRRWLAHQPILARPATLSERTSNWYHRNPRAAILSLTVVLLLAALAAGATTASLWLKQSRDRAVADRDRIARTEAQRVDQLWEALRSEARALQNSGGAGRRFKSLDLLAEAARIKRTDSLRDDVVRSMGLTDLELERYIPNASDGGVILGCDPEIRHYVLGSPDGMLRVMTIEGNRELARLPAAGTPCAYLSFSPDGSTLLCAFPGLGAERAHQIWRWRRETGDDHPEPPVVLAGAARRWFSFTPDGRRVAGPVRSSSEQSQIGIFDVSTGRVIKTLAPGPLVDEPAFDSRGRRLAITSQTSDKVRVIDVEDGTELELNADGPTAGVAWSRDDRLLAAGGQDQRIYVWDVDSKRLVSVLEGHQGRVTALAFTRRGDYLLSSAWDGTTRLWDPVKGVLIVTAEGEDNVLRVAPDDRRVAHSHHETGLMIYRLAIGAESRIVRTGVFGNRTRRLRSIDPLALCFAPDGRLIAALNGGEVLFLDSETGEQENRIALRDASCAQLSPDGSRLATDDRLGVRLWPVRIDRSAVKLLGPARVLNSRPAPAKSTLSWDRSGRLLAACDYERGCGIVFDTASGAEIFRTPGHPRTTAAVLSPDGRFLATATWQRSDVVVWDVERQSMAWRWSCGSATAQFSPDGRWLVTADISQSANEKAFHFWRVGSWSPGPVIVAFQPIEVTFARDGSRCALSSARGVALVELGEGSARVRLRLSWPAGAVPKISALAFDPSGTRLAVGDGDHSFQLWDLTAVEQRLAAMGLE